MEQENADSIEEVEVCGPSLLFCALPAVLSTLPGNIHLVRMFLFTLFLLGIDSAFAMLEAGITVVKDSELGQNRSTKTITGVLCFLGFLGGLYVRCWINVFPDSKLLCEFCYNHDKFL